MSVGEEETKPFTSTDDEEDALLNEAITCSKNLVIKTEDEEEEEEEEDEKKYGLIKVNTEIQNQKITDSELSDKSSNLENRERNIKEEDSISLNMKEEDSISLNVNEEDYRNLEGNETKEIQNAMEEDSEQAELNSNGSIGSPNRKRLREELEEGEIKDSRIRKNSNSSCSTMSNNSKKHAEYETDTNVLARRQKDIDYGKNTIGYDRYIQKVPKDRRTKEHPRTPPMHLKHSRRGWDGMVKLWRKQLHFWDPQDETKKENEDENI